MKSFGGDAREIKYSDEWNSNSLHKNGLYASRTSDDDVDYQQIPYPYLRSVISNPNYTPTFKQKDKQDQKPPQPFTIAFLLNLLFGGFNPNRPGATTTTTAIPMTMSTTMDPAMATVSSRTRRTTQYAIQGNCKNPPKKHGNRKGDKGGKGDKGDKANKEDNSDGGDQRDYDESE